MRSPFAGYKTAAQTHWELTDPAYRWRAWPPTDAFGPGTWFYTQPCEYNERPKGLHGYISASNEWVIPLLAPISPAEVIVPYEPPTEPEPYISTHEYESMF